MKSIYELIPNEIKELGYSKEIIAKIYNQLYIKKNIEVHIEKVVDTPRQVITLEGLIMAMVGMYVVTGARGEKYVITQDTLDMTYDKVLSKPNMYIKKRYPVIVERKDADFVVPNNDANGGFLKGRAGGYIVQSMIYSPNIYPVDKEIFEETYIPYIEYLRDKYGVVDELFLEELQDVEIKEPNIIIKCITWIKEMISNLYNKIRKKGNYEGF